MIGAITALLQRNKPMNTLIKNKRIYLREIVKSDASFMYNLMNQHNWLSYIGDKNIKSVSAAAKYIESGPRLSYKNNGYGLYVVVDIGTDQLVGVCGLMKRAYLNAPDLGFAISEDFYRKGYAFEAAQLILKMVNSLVETDVIYAIVKTENAGSRQLLSKLGFCVEAQTGLEAMESELVGLLLYKAKINK